jgi:carbon monoxide dehydrogenase subunit G
MPSIRKEFSVDAAASRVWDVFRDLGAVATRLAPGFVTECRLDGPDARIVTFVNGFVARERIVDVDDEARRLAYSATGGSLTHHNASFQVFEEGPGRCRIVWIADVLPREAAAVVGQMMDGGTAVMKKTFETTGRETGAGRGGTVRA